MNIFEMEIKYLQKNEEETGNLADFLLGLDKDYETLTAKEINEILVECQVIPFPEDELSKALQVTKDTVKYGIFDLMALEWRVEEYSSRTEALKEFGEYWLGIRLYDEWYDHAAEYDLDPSDNTKEFESFKKAHFSYLSDLKELEKKLYQSYDFEIRVLPWSVGL